MHLRAEIHRRHHPGRHRQPHAGDRIFHALEILLEAGQIGDTDDLADVAERLGEGGAARRLREMAENGFPPVLALDKLRVQLDEEAFHRRRALMAAAAETELGLVLPLPPHVLEEFTELAGTRILATEGHELPRHLRLSDVPVVRGTRACREAASRLGIAVFEARRSNGSFLIAPETSDVIDPRILRADSQLVAHVGPHRHPDDVRLVDELAVRLILL